MRLSACERREGRCWLGLDKGKLRESVGHKATGPNGISAGSWAAEGQMRDMKQVAHQKGLPDRQASQSDTNEHASGVPVPILFVGDAPFCIPRNSLSAQGSMAPRPLVS